MELKDMDLDTSREPGRRFRSEPRPDLSKRSMILKLSGVILLITSLVVFFGRGREDTNAAKELGAVNSRLDGLSTQLTRIEIAEQKISSSEKEIMAIHASLANLEMQAKGMKQNMEKLERPVPQRPEPAAAAPQRKSHSAEKRLHEVRRGETLFSIAKKYGTSAGELRRLNHLTQNSIQPGQRLIVDPGKSL